MQYNTAICLAMAGIALCVWAWGRMSRAIAILGGIVFLGGGLTLAEYLFQSDFGIDQWLFRSYVTTETTNVGRMALVTSLCLTLTGLALLFLGLKSVPRWRPPIVGSLASINLSITSVILIGYALGLPGAFGWSQFTRMAMHTASGISLLSAALFIIAWSLGRQPGERTPRWLPVPIGLGVFVWSILLYLALQGGQDQEIVRTVKAEAESTESLINVRMEARMRSLVRMAQRWEFSGIGAQDAWEAEARNYIKDVPDLHAVEWIDAVNRVHWIVPVAHSETKLNFNPGEDERRNAAAGRAKAEGESIITGIGPLYGGGLGFVIYVPIVIKGQANGFLGAAFDAQLCLQRYLPPAVAPGEALQLSEGGQVFYERDAGEPRTRKNWVVQKTIDLHGATWHLRMWPTPALAARLNPPLPLAVFCFGSLGALLLASVCYYAQRCSRQAIETARTNVELQAALDEVKTLEGLLPICAYCKSVRDDSGYWNQIESYLRKHTKASFSHGYCPECAAKACKEFGLPIPSEIQADIAAGKFEKAV
jgi:sensor domain CHASE-containing protein